IVGAIFSGVVFPVVSHFIQEQPQETANVALKLLHVVLKFLHDLSEQAWLRITLLLLVGFVAGLWVDWLLRRLDGSRAKQREALADERVALGTKMVKLGDDLDDLRSPMQQAGHEIRSCFASAKKFGIWVPDQRVLVIHPDRAKLLVEDYLRQVGTLLKDGNFSSARHMPRRIVNTCSMRLTQSLAYPPPKLRVFDLVGLPPCIIGVFY